MGGEYCEKKLPNMTAEELQAAYQKLYEQECYEYGHRGYSGSFAEKSEVMILVATFPTDAEARDWISGNNDKWGPAMAAQVNHPEPHWYIGGWCSS